MTNLRVTFALMIASIICLTPNVGMADTTPSATGLVSRIDRCPEAGTDKESFQRWLDCEMYRLGISVPWRQPASPLIRTESPWSYSPRLIDTAIVAPDERRSAAKGDTFGY